MKIAIVPKPQVTAYLSGSLSAEKAGEARLVRRDDMPEFAYDLRIDSNSITITAGSDAGFYAAEQSLAQIKAACPGEIPCMLIKDAPKCTYRSFMVDSCRHMQSVEELKKLIDAAALFKMNVFHWHLSDDQGFRIESEKFPLLNEKGSWRNSSDFGKVHEEGRYGGYYTKDEIRSIVTYCSERYIEVVPEIDMPGHSVAMIHAYPKLSCRGLEIPVETKQGIFEDILCAGRDSVFDFVFELLDEVLELFPGKYFHIGGDEAPKKRWKACLKCQQRMKDEGLGSEEELQSWFMNKIIARLRERGRQTIVYNESLAGGTLDSSATVQLWMDKNGDGVKWANRGGRVIASDFFNTYCDYPYSMTPLKKTYGYKIEHKGIAQVMERSVLGTEALIWTEYVRSFEQLCYMCFPRFAAVAELAWTRDEKRDEADFEKRFTAIAPLLRSMGIEPAEQKEWNPNLLMRAGKTIGFFKGKIPWDMIGADD